MQGALDQALVELGAAKPGEVQLWYYPSVSEYSALAERKGIEVRFNTLFDQPTGLSDGAAGMRNWIVMFGVDYMGRPAKRGVRNSSEESKRYSVPNYFATDNGGPITGGCGS
jgi:hypothetical protein